MGQPTEIIDPDGIKIQKAAATDPCDCQGCSAGVGSATFLTADGKTVTVSNGRITAITGP